MKVPQVARRRRRRQRSLCAAIAAITLAVDPVTYAADVSSTWLSGNTGWNNAANWSNSPAVAHFPNNGNGGFTYDATIDSGTTNLGSDIAIEALTLNAGTINTNARDLTVNQQLTWSGG